MYPFPARSVTLLLAALTVLLLLALSAPLAAQPAAAGSSTAGAQAPPAVFRVASSTQKVCQLTGEVDQQRRQVTSTLTQTRFGLSGADLGISFRHRDRIYFFFGDSDSTQDHLTYRPEGGDSIGFTEDLFSRGCAGLGMVTAPDGLYLSPMVTKVSLSHFEVPTGGFSAGERMYVFFATDSTAEQVMGRSILARSDDDGLTFSHVYDVSREKFINVAPVVVRNAAVPGLPADSGWGVLLWASGRYRESDPYLAWLPLDAVETRGAWRYFAGLDPNSRLPRWSPWERDARPLFTHPCIGELSVGWNPFLRVWLMLYNCIENPRGIVYRVAAQPWGPWSPAGVLFDPWDDGGYCHFIHTNGDFLVCDSVFDPGREREWGGEYGPYLISQFTVGDASRSTIYFLMSTWNPYATVLMRATLELGPGGPAAPSHLSVPVRADYLPTSMSPLAEAPPLDAGPPDKRWALTLRPATEPALYLIPSQPGRAGATGGRDGRSLAWAGAGRGPGGERPATEPPMRDDGGRPPARSRAAPIRVEAAARGTRL